MLKKHFIHKDSRLHTKIYHSLMYGKLHHIYMALTLLYAIFFGFTGTAFHNEGFIKLQQGVHILFFGVVLLEVFVKSIINPNDVFKKPWHILQIALLIGAYFNPALLILMIFRFFIYLYTFADHPIINRVVHTFVHSVPTLMMSSSVLMGCLICYSLFTTALFGEAFPELFGHIGKSLFTFVQLMTFDDWIASVLKPVMKVYPMSWIVFFSFILFIVFGVMNIFVGTIVNAMNFVDDSAEDSPTLNQLQAQIKELKDIIQQQSISKGGKS
jgi:voltage-gated sodium channel